MDSHHWDENEKSEAIGKSDSEFIVFTDGMHFLFKKRLWGGGGQANEKKNQGPKTKSREY